MLESTTKLYYSIKEVSELTSLKPYVLRYWESEFPSLKPSKNKAGNRTYKKNDINVAVLAEFSPSCGSSSIYNGNFTGIKVKGAGVTAALLAHNGIKVFNQYQLKEANKLLAF